ncbi:bestrophin family protein [Dongia soli]|uniref:Bestrophin family ion channel n=1 Tax=Dongia soli TaxID=600628 RepID=A0ABU5EA24_9PROT|nr:bestrophin family ion channel [Dongia soli]MDY0883195.1 bestrophin family ion channel [Dongia soli]
MIVRDRPSAFRLFFITRGSIVPRIAPQILLAAILGGVVTFLHERAPEQFPVLTVVPFTLIGLAFAIFLGFRNNAAYDRYWEGRKLWGQLLIDTRSLARQCTMLIGPRMADGQPGEAAEAREVSGRMVYTAIGYAHALRHHLRGTKPDDDLAGYLPQGDMAAALARSNVPDGVLALLGRDLRLCLQRGWISDQLALAIDERLTSMAAVLAGCERIRNTPLPFAYTLLLHRTAYLYCFLLPFGLVDTIGAMTPLVVAIISYTFFGLDALGDEIEEPFGDLPNDLPLSAMSRTIEINLRQALGEKDVPPPLQPVDYCLM